MNLDIAFVVDSTGSMKDDLDAVRDSLYNIVDAISSRTIETTVRFGLVSYRDHPPQDRTYVTKVFDFTDKVSKIHKQISKITPSDGGDIPEAVADGLFDARTKLSWSADAYKVLLLVGDAPPHGKEYNDLTDDYFPKGCPKGHDPKEEVKKMKEEFGHAFFVFVCGCNPLVEESFKSIATVVDGGRYYSLRDSKQLERAILEIMQEMGDLIEDDRRVFDYYQKHDGILDLGTAADELSMDFRDLKVSLSRLLELGRIPQWPKGRPLTSEQLGLRVEFGRVPDAIVAGKLFNYRMRVINPSRATIGIRIIVTLITGSSVSEMTNELYEIGPRDDRVVELALIPMIDEEGKAQIKIEAFYGSKSLVSDVYETRIYSPEV